MSVINESGSNSVVIGLELGLDLPQLPPGQHLNVAAHLFPRSRFTGPNFSDEPDVRNKIMSVIGHTTLTMQKCVREQWVLGLLILYEMGR